MWALSEMASFLGVNGYAVDYASDDVLLITNDEGLDAFVAINGEQILMESVLFAENTVASVEMLNAEILRTHKYFPLTAVGISEIDGIDYYVAFGALSSESTAQSVLIEADLLFQNVVGFLDAFSGYIT